MATLHVRLDFTVSTSPLVPFNSTICPRNAPKWRQKAPKSAQCAPTPRNEERAVSQATRLKIGFRGHLVHPQPPTFCGFQAYIHIYLLIYTPLPNSRWLHHTALRYVTRVQLGPYMSRKGRNSVKTGSKWAHFTCSCTPNGQGSLHEKHVFDPLFTQFWSHNGLFSKHFGIFRGPKRVTTGSKWAKNTCLSIPNGARSLLEKSVFDPFCTHFWSQNGPISRHFGIFHGPKRATTASKRPKNMCLSIPSGLGTTLEKIIFFASGPLVDPLLAPTQRGPRYPPAPPSDHLYGCLGVSLGDFEAWKPQKVGGCGWNRCPQNRILSHVAQNMARAWFRGVGAHCANFGAFWCLFGRLSDI